MNEKSESLLEISEKKDENSGKGCFGIKKEDIKGICIVTFLYFLQEIYTRQD